MTGTVINYEINLIMGFGNHMCKFNISQSICKYICTWTNDPHVSCLFYISIEPVRSELVGTSGQTNYIPATQSLKLYLFLMTLKVFPDNVSSKMHDRSTHSKITSFSCTKDVFITKSSRRLNS